MDDLQSEKEQIDEIRAWWSEYGRYVIAGVVIAVAGLFGFNQYTSSKLAAQSAASALYESLVQQVMDGDLDEAESIADDLANDYSNTSYAAQSKLAMARLYMDKNRDQDAADVLRELLNLRGSDELKNIGKLRLAQILLYQDKPQEVVDLLSQADALSFSALNDELLGDAYLALGKIDLAGEAYNTALADPSPNATIDRALVQMKLVDLPQVSDAAETRDAVRLEDADDAEDAVDPESVGEAVDVVELEDALATEKMRGEGGAE